MASLLQQQLQLYVVVDYGAFTNYVDETMYVDGLGNVINMQIFPFNRKEIPAQMSTRDR